MAPAPELPDPNLKSSMKYTSRRQVVYDDDESQDEADSRHMTSIGNEFAYVNTAGERVSNKPNPRFKNYSGIFKGLIKSSNVTTMYPICTMIITHDSSKAVTVTKKDDTEYYGKQ